MSRAASCAATASTLPTSQETPQPDPASSEPPNTSVGSIERAPPVAPSAVPVLPISSSTSGANPLPLSSIPLSSTPPPPSTVQGPSAAKTEAPSQPPPPPPPPPRPPPPPPQTEQHPHSSSSRPFRRTQETDSEVEATPPAGSVLPTPSLPPPLLPSRLPPLLPPSPMSPPGTGPLPLLPVQPRVLALSPPLSLSPAMPPPRREGRSDKMAVRNLICHASQPAVPLSAEAADELVAASADERIDLGTNVGAGSSLGSGSGVDVLGNTQRQEPRAKRPWTGTEDVQLRRLVSQFGQGLWAAIAAQIPGRSGKQVRERWLNHLSPHVTKRPWSADEDAVILDSHRRYGNCWSKIAKLLEGRSDNSVKNRFYTTLKRRLSGPNSPAAPLSNSSPPQPVVAGSSASGTAGSSFGLAPDGGIAKKRRSSRAAQPSEQVEITKPRYKPARVWE